MTSALTLVRLFPAAFVGRLAIAFAEIALAATVLVGSIYVGHELKAWREWYADPATQHPWAPTPAPSAEPDAAAN